jgi:hypothetical protein
MIHFNRSVGRWERITLVLSELPTTLVVGFLARRVILLSVLNTELVEELLSPSVVKIIF